ncbi:MAG: hypothetical protein EA391_12595 [Balneolaceae bacterium]|nr:MAG: hypothetical protein EA391_12595 [Balneolaceae bacterium]
MMILMCENNFTTNRSLRKIKDTIMKHFTKPGNAVAVLLMAMTFIVAACSTTGIQRSEDVQSDMRTVDNDIKLIVVQLDAINASLDELTKPGQADVRRAFDVYSKNVSKIEKMEKDFSKHADQMTKSGKKYFEAWDKNKNQYDNPDLQRSSDERRATLGRTYDRIGENNKGVKEAFRAYVSDVTQIESYMSNDLTTEGITSIASMSDRTVRNGLHLKNELVNLQSAIEDARAEMTQTGISMN